MSAHSLTAEKRFEAGHSRRLWLGLLGAVFVHLALALTLPNPHFQPYQLAEQAVIHVLDVPSAIVVPPPPKEIPKPDLVPAIAPSDNPEADETMPTTALDPRAPVSEEVAERRESFTIIFDEPPVVVRQVYPVYPELARQAELEGTVLLKVGVDESGRVREVLVLRSVSGLDKAAIDAVYQWEFLPATQRDVPVPVWITVPIRFSLRG